MNVELERNLINLNQFWQALNANKKDNILTHVSWPNKQWRSDFSLPEHELSETMIAGKSFSTIIDININEFNAITIKNQLIPMNVNVDKQELFVEESYSKVVTLTADDNAEKWSLACGLAFGYTIDANVIQRLLSNVNATVLAYLVEGEIAGTAISYQTCDALGIHQLGTVPSFRKMGVAAALMDYIINKAKQSDVINNVCLQASPAGIHLYEKMGFQALGKLTSMVLKTE